MLYCIVTYGCQMNLHESEKAAAIFESRGYCATNDPEKADLIFFNTCCIREGAENRALGNIGAVKRLKKKNPSLIVIVVGCMPQQEGKAAALKEKFPFLDIVLGTHNLMSLGEKLDDVRRDRISFCEITSEDDPDMDRYPARRSSGLNAWTNIMYGCNNFCTYCIVPYVRGREHSRPSEEILKEIEAAVAHGYREVTLLGQNVNSYGNDGSEGVSFAELLKKASAIKGDFRIKYMTSHPKDFNCVVAETMRDEPHLAHTLHLPVQSGSDRILRAMNRKYSVKDYLGEIETVRSLIPDIGLSTDVMVGFPGETEEDFQATLDLVRKVRFDNMFMFVYSRRPGTPADKMDNQIPQEVKDRRIHELVAEHRKISAEIAAECLGKEYRSLIEFADGKLTASTDNGRYVRLNAADERLHGKFLRIKVTGHRAGKLIGELCE